MLENAFDFAQRFLSSSRSLVENAIDTARELLRRFNQALPAEVPTLADELLLYLYRLKDEFVIVRSTSRLFTGKSFAVLQNLIYNLESAPDETLHNPATVDFVRAVLEDLIRGNILIQKKS